MSAAPISFSSGKRKTPSIGLVRNSAINGRRPAAKTASANGSGSKEGFALDLASGGGDAKDAEFERF
jgi:hypothetical protein